MTKTQEDFFDKIFTSHFIARARKGCVGFYCERELEIEHNWNILTPLLWPSRCVFLVLLMLNWRPRAHCWMLAFFIASYQHLLCTPNSIGRVWLSLPHLVSSCLKLYRQLLARRTQLNYIIVRRPLDLWNRMFNRHQAEITVMQFTGHSLPVHHSVVYHGNFLARPILSANFRPHDFLS